MIITKPFSSQVYHKGTIKCLEILFWKSDPTRGLLEVFICDITRYLTVMSVVDVCAGMC